MLAEGRDPGSRSNARSGESREIGVSLETPVKVQKLQEALHAKAKRAPDYRFYALYDKLYRFDVLSYAYVRCLANKGAAGVDSQTFDDIKEYGLVRWLDELAEEIGRASCRERVCT